MKNSNVTMVNPQQIVNKGLKGCGNTRTVMAFAQKYGVPCVWWSPNRSQKILLVDWPQFRTTWSQVWSGQWTWPTTNRTTNHTGVGFTTNYRTTTKPRTTTTRTTANTKTRRTYGTTPKRTTTNRSTGYTTYSKRTRRAA